MRGARVATKKLKLLTREARGRLIKEVHARNSHFRHRVSDVDIMSVYIIDMYWYIGCVVLMSTHILCESMWTYNKLCLCVSV